MTTVSEDTTAFVSIAIGKSAVISTSGQARVQRVSGMADAGFSTDFLRDEARTYVARDTDAVVSVEALSGDAEYVVAYLDVDSRNVRFRRGDDGNIDALIDDATGETVSLGGSGEDTSTWANLPGKPAVIAAGADAAAARTVIGLGTAATTAATAYATAAQGAKADSALQAAALTPYAKTDDLPQAANVADADPTDAASVAASLDALRDALVTAGLMASA